jgi:hypothetical protein
LDRLQLLLALHTLDRVLLRRRAARGDARGRDALIRRVHAYPTALVPPVIPTARFAACLRTERIEDRALGLPVIGCGLDETTTGPLGTAAEAEAEAEAGGSFGASFSVCASASSLAVVAARVRPRLKLSFAPVSAW